VHTSTSLALACRARADWGEADFSDAASGDRFLELVRQPASSKEAANLTARFTIVEFTTDESPEVRTYDHSDDEFRFLFAAGVEPTTTPVSNNSALASSIAASLKAPAVQPGSDIMNVWGR